MKFICLGYFQEKKWDNMSQDQQAAMMEECIAYDDVLRAAGHVVGGEALQSSRTAKTLRWQGASCWSPMVPSPKPKNN